MPCSYYNISIVSRANGSSSVASAAYQSGEALFEERTNHQISYENKEGISHAEIMLPDHAPDEFMDRKTLWNSVEEIEKQYNSQLARKIVAALPRELPREDQIQLVRDYCQENFVSKGMCVDFAIHDNEDGNPHTHILMTLRPMNEHGEWMPKSHKVYDLDESGNKILLSSGYYASHKEKTTDWDEQSNAEKWRHSWEKHTNAYLEKNGVESRLDMRSYERQGSDRIAQIHMGPAVYQMEKRGIKTFIGDLNRSIQKMNEQLQQIKEMIEKLISRVADLKTQLSHALDELKVPFVKGPPITLEDFLLRYIQDRKQETGKEQKERETVITILQYLKDRNIKSIPDLEDNLVISKNKLSVVQHKMASNQARINTINSYDYSLTVIKENKEIYGQYRNQHFKTRREKIYQANKDKIDSYMKAQRSITKLKNSYPDKKIPWKALREERSQLSSENKHLKSEADELQAHCSRLEKTMDYVDKVQLKDTLRDAIQKEKERLAENTPSIMTHEPIMRRKHDLER